MKYIKKFETIQAANGVVIPNPFIGHAEGQLITNDEDNKKLEVENGIIKVVNNTQSKITPTVSFKLITEESGNDFYINDTKVNVGSTVQWSDGHNVYISLGYDGQKEIIQLITDSTGSVSFVYDGEEEEAPAVECENLGDNILQFTNGSAMGYDFPYNLIIAETETHSELVIPCSVWCDD